MQQAVSHNSFGSGKVARIDGNYVSVAFDDADVGCRKFLYPDAFDSFLRFSDPAEQTAVETLLVKKMRVRQEEQWRFRLEKERKEKERDEEEARLKKAEAAARRKTKRA